MQSLVSWIDTEEFESLAKALLGKVERPTHSVPGAATPHAGRRPDVRRPAEAEPEASPVPGHPAPEPAEDLSTQVGPVDAQLVERVRQKLCEIMEKHRENEAPVSGGESGDTCDEDLGESSGTVEGDSVDAGFKPGDGGLLERLQRFSAWAEGVVGAPVAVLDWRGDALVSCPGDEAWAEAVALAARTLTGISGLLRAEPESKGSRMAWLVADDGAALVVVGSELAGRAVWVGWIDRHGTDRATLVDIGGALRSAVEGTEPAGWDEDEDCQPPVRESPQAS